MTASVPGLLVYVRPIAHALLQGGGELRASALRYRFELLRELSTELWYGTGLISAVTLLAIAGARLRGVSLSARGAALSGLSVLSLAASLAIQPMVPIGAVALLAASLALPLTPDRARLSGPRGSPPRWPPRGPRAT